MSKPYSESASECTRRIQDSLTGACIDSQCLRHASPIGQSTREGRLTIQGWFGAITSHVVVVGETPKRYRIKAPGGVRVKLAGRDRYISGEQTALVPKYAVALS